MTLQESATSVPSASLQSPVSRRTVVAAAAWGVPAVSLASAAPAFANGSSVSNMTIAGPTAGVPASGAVPMTVTVKDAQGQPQAGQPVSFSGPEGSSFDAADGVTNGAGQYTANFNLNKPWAAPGGTVTVTAVSGSGNASQGFGVLGANVLGWGSGLFGMSGLGTTDNVSSPRQLLQVFPSPVVQVAQGGYNFTLFRLSNGDVWGVGRNGNGQLADGTTTDRYWPPQRIAGLSNVVDIAAGYATGYAVMPDGTVRSWGSNYESALGDGTTYAQKSSSTSIVTVSNASNVAKVAGGSWFGLALLKDHTVIGWGRNGAGQLGDTTNVQRSSAVSVSGVSDVTQIAATSVAGYALRTDGSIMAWGGNWKGQQGDGSTQSGNRYTPAPVVGISTAASIAAASQTGYALLADKTVVAWGDGENGELGNGASSASASVVTVQDLSGVSQIGSGYALKTDGTLWAWGSNSNGQLGNGSSASNSNVPVQVSLPAGIPVTAIGGSPDGGARFAIAGDLSLNVDVVQTQVSAGTAGTVQATVSSGSSGVAGAEVSLTATGNAVLGASLGQTNAAGVFQTSVTPDRWTMPGTQLQVRASTDAASSVDGYTVLGANVLGAGTGVWGSMGLHNDGWPTSVSTPTQADTVFASPVVQAVSNNSSSLVLLADGTVWGVGQNGYSELSGSGQISSWTQVSGVSNATQIVMGDYSSAALLRDGSVMAWGTGAMGQLGDNSGPNAVWNAPQKINELSGVRAIAAGWATVYALMSDNTVRACGWGTLGQIGDGQGKDVYTFVTVPNLGGIDKIVTYPGCCVARKSSDGSLWFWGYDGAPTGYVLSPTAVPDMDGIKDFSPTLAVKNDGSVYQYSRLTTPVKITGMSDPILIASNEFHQYVVLSDGTIKAWGKNTYGELGDGTTTDQSSPVPVVGLDGLNVASIWPSIRDKRVFFVTSSTSTTVDVADTQVSAGIASAVQAKVAAGSRGVAGAAVTLTATDNAVIAAPTGMTNSSGVFQTTVTPDPWTTPGDVVRVTATSNSNSAQDTFRVLGSNLAGQGAGFGGNNQSVVQSDTVFPSPVVQIASACGDGWGDTWWMALLQDGTVWTRGFEDAYGHLAGGGTAGSSPTWGKVPLLSNVTQIAMMYASGFALLQSGKVMAWGANWLGQLGTGSTNVPSGPVEIAGLSNVTAITVGDRTGYALLSDGTVKAWGQNDSGEVGNETFTNPVLSPVSVSGLSNVKQIAATRHTGLALLGDGTVWSWGNNSTAAPASNNSAWGLVGDGSSSNQSKPVKLTSLSGVARISGGGQAAFAVLADKTVMAWSTNANGAVGDGSTTNRTTPVAISGLSNVVSISALDANGFALLADGTVKAWGKNSWGQLCDGSTADRLSPVTATSAVNGHPVSSLPVRGPRGLYSGFFLYGNPTVTLDVPSAVTAGAGSALTATVSSGSTPVAGAAVTLSATGGAVLAAASGQTNGSGQFQTTVTPDVWTRPGASLSVTAASGSSTAADVYTVVGSNLMHTGYGLWGAGGDGTNNNATTATQTSRVFPSPVVQAYTGYIFGVVLLADGSVWSVGRNDYYQLGDASSGRSTWGRIAGLPANIVQITGGRSTVYALTADGDVYAWGWNANGQIGNGTTTDQSSPVKVPGLSGVKRLGGAYRSCFAIMGDGSVKAWGKNDGGSLGDGTTTQRLSPVSVSAWGTVSDIGGDHQQTAALRTDGTVWACSAVSGTLGNGDGATSASPVQVNGLSGIQALGVGFGFFHVLKSDGTVAGWGANDVGQIGNGGSSTVLSPTAVSGLSGVSKIADRWGGGYALLSNGQVWGWGKNDSGQLGDGTTTNRLSPVQMGGLASRSVSSLNAGVSAEGCFLVV